MARTRSGLSTSGRPTRSPRVIARARRAIGSNDTTVTKHYKDGDNCRRHRVEDGSPKTVQVTSYRRRR